MEYADALKQVKTKKTASNPYLLISFDYNMQFILPYKAGIAFLENLQNAELIKHRHSTYPEIRSLDLETVEVNYMSEAEYQRYKIAQLMKISYREIEDLEIQNS